MSSQPPKAFISYAREDRKYKDQLVVHLQSLIQQGVLSNWHDGLLVAGQQWNTEIIKHLDDSRVLLLLISPDFIASDYIHNTELKRAGEQYAREEGRVIPVLVRNVHGWQNKPFGEQRLGDFQALPGNFEFIVDWDNTDAAFADVVAGIEQAVKSLTPVYISAAIAVIPRPPVVGFIARRDERGRDIVERLKKELAPQGNRLVTLSGPGGIGKTTLAAEAARALKKVFGGRVVWSRAEGRADFALSALLDDISKQLGREDLWTLTPAVKEAQVRELVADPPALIVLDNYETIAPDAKKGIEEWLALAQCSALFTSQHRIVSTRNISIPAMSREEAQEYLERLVAETLDSEIYTDAVRQRIYETAEANPYVMQWVVAQIDEAQEPQAVLEELAQGEGEAALRVFDRSFNLPHLGDDGRAALLALSLFAPSATRAALAQVAGFGDDLERVNEAVRNLRASWLIKGIDDYRRFTVEGLTRSLARARLLKDERAGEFRQRFVAHFLRYAEAHAQPKPEDFDKLEAEKDNVLGAVDAAFAMGDWLSVMRIGVVLTRSSTGMLSVRGHWDEAIRLCEQAAAAAQKAENEPMVTYLAVNAGTMRMSRGEYDEAGRTLRQALAASRKLGNEDSVAACLHELGRLAQAQGDLPEARRLYNESFEIIKRTGDQTRTAITLHNLAAIARAQEDLPEARRLYHESLEIKKRLGNQGGVAITLHSLAAIAQNQGDLPEARRLYNESLEITKRLGDQNLIAITLHNLAIITQNQDDLPEAQRLYNESLKISKRLGNQRAIASSLHQMGRLAQMQGDSAQAWRLYNEGLEIERKLGDQSGIAKTLHNLGKFAEVDDNKVEAARLFRESLAIYERLKSPFAEVVRQSLASVETEGA